MVQEVTKNIDVLRYELKVLCDQFNREKANWWLDKNGDLVLIKGTNPFETYKRIVEKKTEIEWCEMGVRTLSVSLKREEENAKAD